MAVVTDRSRRRVLTVASVALLILAGLASTGVLAPVAEVTGTASGDADGDGVPDGLEGSDAFPGSDQGRLDLYVQLHYSEGIDPLSAAERTQLRRVWAAMPVENPDGSTGVAIHVDDTPPHGGQLDERVRLDDAAAKSALAERYYTEARLGERHCVARQVVLGEVDAEGYAGIGDAPGRFAVVDGTWTRSYGGSVSYRVRMVTHELLHTVVGEVPASSVGDDDLHTRTGWLSTATGNLDRNEHLSEPVAERLSEEGFADGHRERDGCS